MKLSCTKKGLLIENKPINMFVSFAQGKNGEKKITNSYNFSLVIQLYINSTGKLIWKTKLNFTIQEINQ